MSTYDVAKWVFAVAFILLLILLAVWATNFNTESEPTAVKINPLVPIENGGKVLDYKIYESRDRSYVDIQRWLLEIVIPRAMTHDKKDIKRTVMEAVYAHSKRRGKGTHQPYPYYWVFIRCSSTQMFAYARMFFTPGGTEDGWGDVPYDYKEPFMYGGFKVTLSEKTDGSLSQEEYIKLFGLTSCI